MAYTLPVERLSPKQTEIVRCLGPGQNLWSLRLDLLQGSLRDLWHSPIDPHILEKLQALEIMGLGVLGGGAMAGNFPHMCNGANLAFRREAFIEVGGYEGIDHIASGDDELLLQKIRKYTSYQVAFCACKSAIVTTPALTTWAELRAQRIRWVSKARYYLDARVNVLQLLSYLAFWGIPIIGILAITNPLAQSCFFTLLLLKFSADFLLMKVAAQFFGEQKLLWLLPLLEVIYTAYVLWIGIAGNTVSTYTWKGRTVK